MLKMHMPRKAVEIKMQAEGFSPDLLDHPDDPQRTVLARQAPPAVKNTSGQGDKRRKWAKVQTDFDQENGEGEGRLLTASYFLSKPCMDIDNPQWESLEAVCLSSAGDIRDRGGVVFVETDAGVAVLKGCNDIALEVFASMIGRDIMGWNAMPRTRVFDSKSKEHESLYNTVCIYLMAKEEEDASSAKAVGRVRNGVGFHLNQSHLAVMELVQNGQMLESLPPDVAKAVLDPKTDGGRQRLEEIGRMMVFDMLINNSDRIPLIWDNEGNPRNFLVRTGHSGDGASEPNFEIVPIDQAVRCIDPEDANSTTNHERYMSRVTAVATAVCGGSRPEQLAAIDPARKFLDKAVGEADQHEEKECLLAQLIQDATMALGSAERDGFEAKAQTYREELSQLRAQQAELQAGKTEVSHGFLGEQGADALLSGLRDGILQAAALDSSRIQSAFAALEEAGGDLKDCQTWSTSCSTIHISFFEGVLARLREAAATIP